MKTQARGARTLARMRPRRSAPALTQAHARPVRDGHCGAPRRGRCPPVQHVCAAPHRGPTNGPGSSLGSSSTLGRCLQRESPRAARGRMVCMCVHAGGRVKVCACVRASEPVCACMCTHVKPTPMSRCERMLATQASARARTHKHAQPYATHTRNALLCEHLHAHTCRLSPTGWFHLFFPFPPFFLLFSFCGQIWTHTNRKRSGSSSSSSISSSSSSSACTSL